MDGTLRAQRAYVAAANGRRLGRLRPPLLRDPRRRSPAAQERSVLANVYSDSKSSKAKARSLRCTILYISRDPDPEERPLCAISLAIYGNIIAERFNAAY